MSNRNFSVSFINKKIEGQNRASMMNPATSYNNGLIPPVIHKENYSNDINEIFDKIKAESASSVPSNTYQSILVLSFYIRRNRPNLDEIIKKISFFLNSNSGEINNKLLVSIINMVLNLLTENNHIINFVNMTLPILVNYLTFYNKSLSSFEEINHTIGRLIKTGGDSIKQIIEKNIESLMTRFVNEDEFTNLKFENKKFALIQYLCKIMENSSLYIFNKIKEKSTFEIFLGILDFFKDPKPEVRYITGELVKQFIHMISERDRKTKDEYIVIIYNYIYCQYVIHAHVSNGEPSNSDMVKGFLIILQKIYFSEPSFFKDPSLYTKLVENLMECKNSIKYPQVFIEFIKFVPQLLQMNKDLFIEHFLKDFLEFANTLLNINTSYEIRNALFLTLGTLSLVVDRGSFDSTLTNLLSLIKTLFKEKDILDKEMVKCLSDMFSNKDNVYLEVIRKELNLFEILKKLFRTSVSNYQLELLQSIMSGFNNFSREHITTAIISLNVVSFILCDDNCDLQYFYQNSDENTQQLISPQLPVILSEASKNIKKNILNQYTESFPDDETEDMSKNAPVYIKCKCLNNPKLIIGALRLFSKVRHSLFGKDMLIFYSKNIIPFLSFATSNVVKKILDIISCKFIKVYEDDINLSTYTLNNILDSINNVLITSHDISVVLYAIDTINQKPLFVDYVLQRKDIFFSRIIGNLSDPYMDDFLKEKLIKTIGLLASSNSKYNDKKYFITLVKKNIKTFLYTLENTDDIIQKENMVNLLLYYHKYLKNFLDFNLIENTMESLLYLMLGYNYQGNIIINILKVVCQLLNNDLTIKNIGGNKKFDEYCQLLLLICIINIKESAVNTFKSEISLQTMYTIIKLQKIDIYKDYTPKLTQTLNTVNENKTGKNTSPNKLFLKKLSVNLIQDKVNEKSSKNNLSENNEAITNINTEKSQINILKLLFGEKGENINLVEILLQSVIKGASDESLKSIMNIFGLCGALEPTQMEKYFKFYGLSLYLSDQDYSLEENDFKISRFNPKTKTFEEIDLSKIDISTIQAVVSLMRILKDNTQKELSTQIITHLEELIKSLSGEEANLIDIILPKIIEVIPKFELHNQKNLFGNLLIIITQFKKKIKFFLDDIIHLIKNYIFNERYFEIISKILAKLFEEFVSEMEKYFTFFIPTFLHLMKKNINNNDLVSNIISLISLLTSNKNISGYIGLILEELCMIYINSTDEKVLSSFLKLFKQIVYLENIYLLYPLIIRTLIEKLALIVNPKYYMNLSDNNNNNNNNLISLLNILYSPVDVNKLSKERKLEYLFKSGPYQAVNELILTKSLDVFIAMSNTNMSHFISFLPLIASTFYESGILQFSNSKYKMKELLLDYNDYTFMDEVDLKDRICSQICDTNCFFGYYSPQKMKDDSNDDIHERIRNRITINKKNQIDNVSIIKQFNTSYISEEEDWNEWFKSTSKILFEQSPIYALYLCHVVADYYFPLVIELYDYGFFSIYEKLSNNNQVVILNDLRKCLNNPKTPNDVLLNILNLYEFFKRRNLHLKLIDYRQFGNIAYKCRAFAKALYYKENDFIIRNDFENFEDLLELYYELKHPESAIGLLKLLENKKNMLLKNKKNEDEEDDEENNEIINYNNKYILYIKLHDFDKALKIIEEKLSIESDDKNIELLKKNRDICLTGLCDWEELFNNEENDVNYNIDDESDSRSESGSSEDNVIKQKSQDKEGEKEKGKNKEKGKDNEEENNDNKKNEERKNEINRIIDKEIILSKACMNLSRWSQLKFHFSRIQNLFKNDKSAYEQLIMNTKDDILMKDFNINEEDEDQIEENNYYNNHGIIKNKINDVLNDDTDIYNKYLLLDNYNSRKKVKSGDKIELTGSHRYSDRGSAIGLQLFKENDFIAYHEIISKNSDFNFLEGNSEILFDLNLYSIILNINNGQFDIALKFIDSAKKIIVNGIKSLLSESYERGYELLVKNQLLFQLEQIIEYKQFHEKDQDYLKQMVSLWDKNLNIIGKDPDIYEKILSLRSLVLPLEDEVGKYINLAKIYRKLSMYEQSEKILKRLKVQLKLTDFDLGAANYTMDKGNKENNINNKFGNDTIYELNDDDSNKSEFKLIKDNLLLTKEIKAEIELNYNQCLFEKGKVNEALDKSKYLVDLLEKSEGNLLMYNTDLDKLNNKIKSKIYGDYAIYKQNKFINNLNLNLLKNLAKKDNIESKISMRRTNSLGTFKKTKSLKVNQVTDLRSSMKIGKKPKNEEVDEKSEANNINKYLILSTKYNNNSYKLWHSYALFNYIYYKFISKDKSTSNDEIDFANNAVNGFRHALIIGGKNKNKTYQDLLRLSDIFFSSGMKNDSLLLNISNTLNVVEVEAYLNILPQLLCRFDITDKKVLEILISILIKIGSAHPQAVIYSFIVMKLSSSKKRKSAAGQILYSICKNNSSIKDLVRECEMFIREINKCAMLLHEEWFETLENTSKMYYSKDYQGMIKYLVKLHEKAKLTHENMYEVHFYQKFGSEINEAEYYLKDYMENHNLIALNQAWDIYLNIYYEISESFRNFDTISLEYISSKLSNFQNSKICLPGSYILKSENAKLKKLIRIQKMGSILRVFNTKQHPRKISMIGTDDKEYLFLLKGHEDLRQDERCMQLFNLVNTILANDKSTSNKNLDIITYSVFPLSHNTGIIGWVPNCDTLNVLIKESRTMSNTVISAEHRKIFKLYPKFESANMLNKIEMFKEAINETQGTEISNMIWIKSKNCETWLNRRTNYSRSLAVMSIVGYILGLGDRHPSNLMMSRKTGKIIHIDFGDCFEVAMKRDKFPEKVPFRLTRMLVKALEVSGIEGTFRVISEKVMELLRNNNDSLLAILGSFLYDPLISFRLMIPMIVKMKKEQNKLKNSNNDIFLTRGINFNKSLSKSLTSKTGILDKYKKHYEETNIEPLILKCAIKGNIIERHANNITKKRNVKDDNNITNYKGRRESTIQADFIKGMEHMVKNKEEKINDEKKKMVDDERQMFILYEENDEIDEIDSDKLNNIAKIVLNRIHDKLIGTDIRPDTFYDAKSQVDELIKSATSNENLAQSYLGWCPFW